MSDVSDRLNAALQGRYRIERQLGEGGMATVYLADDLRHERKVALKVLKPELAAVVGAERFLAEIKTTANLQHPHILPLFDSGEADSFLFFVMPYVEGDTLRDKIDREKQLSVDEALKIAEKVASALDYAHRHGVVHRDIKPGNILLSSEGEPTVADFGIALAVAQAGGGRVTETGLSLGTPHYMSPEQATGDRDVDSRTDVYALGCVLYEMLTGDPPYQGTTAQAVLGQILTGDPVRASKKRASVPANVDAAIRKALERLPADRFTGAQEFAKALGDAGFRHGEEAIAGAAVGVGPWKRLTVVFASIAAFSTLTALVLMFRDGTPVSVPATPFRAVLTDFRYVAPAGSGNRIAISKDGSLFAVARSTAGIFVRDAAQEGFQEIPGTDGATHPGFSPDGRWLVFDAEDGVISRVEVSGGPILPIVEGRHPHWGLDDMLVFQGPSDGLYLVAPSGGEPVQILDNVNGSGRPFLLPDGKAVIFQNALPEGRRLMVVEIESGEVTDLGIAGDNPRYIPTGYLVFGHQDQALMAMPFDLDTHSVTGQPSTILPDVLVYGGGATQFAVSETGTALYTGGGSVSSELVWVSRAGAVESVDPAWVQDFFDPSLSPDGTRLAVRGVSPIFS